ncbi:YkgJ family cysteine cluster protein [Candidatus Bathyarchaeota archaeon]|nr:YkgJ family cysteine cluster protein [Candidatus Bathyarchaeota archaeon]
MLLSLNDIEKIKKLGFKEKFFLINEGGWLKLKNKHGKCVFLKNGKCVIYEFKPLGCQLYPLIYDKNEGPIIDKLCPFNKKFKASELEMKILIKFIEALKKERINRLTLYNSHCF